MRLRNLSLTYLREHEKYPGSYHAMQNGYWGESHGCELQGKRIGLVGYGNIGKTLAKRLSGFDVEL